VEKPAFYDIFLSNSPELGDNLVKNA